MEFNSQLLDTLECLGALVEQDQKLQQEKSAATDNVRTLIPGAVEALALHGRIEEREKTAMVRALADHATAIEYITKLAAQRTGTALAPSSLGSEVSPRAKVASVAAPGNRRRETPASELAWTNSLGIPNTSN